ncbi:MAG: HAMP domain-containing histidine kinase [Gammaproteobacteria bacterium]|nr:HAMP domain-containing histidine kinase [Gammaproteobacteria bacterium]
MQKLLHLIAHSLSARILGVFFLTALVYSVAARHAVNLVLDRDYLREMIGSHVALHTTYLLEDLGYPPSIERAGELARDNAMDIRISGPGVEWASDPNFPVDETLAYQPSEFFTHLDFTRETWRQQEDLLRGMGFSRYEDHSFVRIEHDDYRITLASPKLSTSPGPNLATPLVSILSILVLMGCFFAVSWLVRPIKWIKEGTERIGQGDLDYRIPKTRSDDLGELAVDINRMADDVKGMLEAKQQMLLAISHELRSPLTRTKVAVEFVDDDQARQSILDDVEEMERLIADLLESERLNTRHSKLQLSRVDVSQLARDLVELDFDEETDRLKVTTLGAPLLRELDATRVRLLIKNLIDNALCHTPADADGVEVAVVKEGGDAVVRVIDHGVGMTPENVDRATEPFYRADPARCRDTGGFGLGLYLCRRIAEAHGGTLTIASEPGKGTTVTLRLPESLA